MTTLASEFYVPHSLPSRGYSGSSAESGVVRKEFESMRRHVRAAASTLQSQAHMTLVQVAVECAHPNWDGYGSKAISASTVRRTLMFLDCLPSAMPPPDIIPQADGELAIEWHISPYQNFAVSISERGPVHYAGLFSKDEESHGMAKFETSIPEDILFHVNKLLHRIIPSRAA